MPGSAGNKLPRTFEDPFENWPNDDLLIEQQTRNKLQEKYPAIFPLLDWPELRAYFSEHNSLALLAQKKCRRFGVVTVLFGFLGLLISGISPILLHAFDPGWASLLGRILGFLGAVFVFLGGIAGYIHLFVYNEKLEWLENRLVCERLRQFYFQYMVSRISMVAKILDTGSVVSEFIADRTREFSRFTTEYMFPLVEKYEELKNDKVEEKAWLNPDWEKAELKEPLAESSREFLKILENNRLGIQKRYADKKIRPGLYSPNSRSIVIASSSDVLTVAVLFVTFGTCVAYLTGAPSGAPFVLACISVSSALSAVIVSLRVLNAGLLLTEDAERYSWYHAAVDALQRRYKRADDREKCEILKEMEYTSYQELRRFIIAMEKARFVI